MEYVFILRPNPKTGTYNMIKRALTIGFMFLCSIIAKAQEAKPLNVIIMIGDGMGHSQMSSAYYFSDDTPNFSRFPVVGLSRTSSSSDKITDSAAGATAISTGKKTKNGYVGMDPRKKAVENLVEYFSRLNKSTGIVVTSSVTHATPASFYAHVKSRNKEFKIARQLPESQLDFIAGGGLKFFTEDDNNDLMDVLRSKGFAISRDTAALQEEQDSEKRIFLLSDNGMPKVMEGRANYLSRATEAALRHLASDSTGFFLMIEGSQIDWAGHANNAEYLVQEVLDFDRAIGKVMDFAEKDGNTLVIVTADHETGGFSLNAKEVKVPFFGKSRNYDKIRPGFSTGGHSAALVPVLAFGPGSNKFGGIYENTQIHGRILQLFSQDRDR